MRHIPTLGNYDYVVDYVFSPQGNIRLRVGATGFDAIKSVAAKDMDAPRPGRNGLWQSDCPLYRGAIPRPLFQPGRRSASLLRLVLVVLVLLGLAPLDHFGLAAAAGAAAASAGVASTSARGATTCTSIVSDRSRAVHLRVGRAGRARGRLAISQLADVDRRCARESRRQALDLDFAVHEVEHAALQLDALRLARAARRAP